MIQQIPSTQSATHLLSTELSLLSHFLLEILEMEHSNPSNKRILFDFPEIKKKRGGLNEKQKNLCRSVSKPTVKINVRVDLNFCLDFCQPCGSTVFASQGLSFSAVMKDSPSTEEDLPSWSIYHDGRGRQENSGFLSGLWCSQAFLCSGGYCLGMAKSQAVS